MSVRRPDSGAPLRRAGAGGEAVAAIDATFSAPKSVSAVWALASHELREQIERAHEQAIDRTLVYATGQVAMVRERIDSQRVIHTKASDVIATSWRHTTARAVDGRPPDPQLHSHVLLHAAVRRDGQVVAIDSRAWFVHRRELGAVYRTELARQLAVLGFEIERSTGRGGRYFELRGVPTALIDRWSSRHHEVQEAIQRRLHDKQALLAEIASRGGPDARDAAAQLGRLLRTGQLAPGEDRYLGSSTRTAKQRPLTHEDLDHRWQQTAEQLRFDRRAVEQLRAPERLVLPASDCELLDRLTEFDATFTNREARAAALEASAGLSIEQALSGLARLRWQGQLLALADGTSTTSAHRAAERRAVSLAQTLAAAEHPAVPEPHVEAQLRTLETRLERQGGQLTAEQRDAVALACSGRQLVMIEGQAGSGKSTTLAAIGRAHQADGRRLIITSTAALAAQRLARELGEAGVNAPGYSTHALHQAIQSGPVVLDQRTTVIHDEAALASTREQHRLFAAVHGSGARLIEVGDPRQSQAVGAGGLWPHLENAARNNQARVELTRNVRAHDPADRHAQKLFRDGHHAQAIREYHARGRVNLADDQHQAEDAALETAQAHRQAGKRSLVIAQTSNEHLDELNARAQAIRIEHGQLASDRVPVTGRPYCLHAGDEIQLRRSINHPDVGPLLNGTTGQVIDVDNERQLVRIELTDRRSLVFDRDQLDRTEVRLPTSSTRSPPRDRPQTPRT